MHSYEMLKKVDSGRFLFRKYAKYAAFASTIKANICALILGKTTGLFGALDGSFRPGTLIFFQDAVVVQ
jgi:hypothetical protein